MMDVSGFTVSEIVNRFPRELQDLRRLAVELNKFSLSIPEAKEGLKLQHELVEVNVEPDEIKDFIQAVGKIGEDSGYAPAELVQSAMRLSCLEESSGKSYSETIRDFEAMTRSSEKLKKKQRKLRQDIRDLKNEREKNLAENHVTDDEIRYTVNLREELRTYGVNLEDADELQKYLENMRETGGKPEKFVEYTKKHESLKRLATSLKQRVDQETLNLQNLQERQDVVDAAINTSLPKVSELNKQEDEIQSRLLRLQGETHEAEQEKQQTLKKLAALLEVEAEAEGTAEAMAVKKAKLDEIDTEITGKEEKILALQKRAQDLENKNCKLKSKISDKLKIKDYVNQLQTAIADEERRRLSLENENKEKEERIALADTITNFLTRIAPYDFNRLCYFIEMLKKMRQREMSQPNLQAAVMEEEIRFLAMKAFEGDFASTAEYSTLKEENRKLREALSESKTKVEEMKVKHKSALREEESLETSRTNLEQSARPGESEGRSPGTWEEIEKMLKEKYNVVAVGTSGTHEMLFAKTNDTS